MYRITGQGYTILSFRNPPQTADKYQNGENDFTVTLLIRDKVLNMNPDNCK
jgi:hypothetical protein